VSLYGSSDLFERHTETLKFLCRFERNEGFPFRKFCYTSATLGPMEYIRY
jgi:hypothetical protein